ncbi:MAG: sigma 54-interacting transcriptional regulator [Burkholderiales bacterium]|nr:sigma 54-interacting transcriptional regulator [Burkholderiales bacterium]
MASPASRLALDDEKVLELANRSLFDAFALSAMGMMVVDREHRVVWISEGYKRFLPALGHAEGDFVGRRVEEVVPNTLMPQVIDSGQPMLVDLLSNHAGTFLVSRLPLRDEQGEVIGAIGMVLLDHPETTMQPLIAKFSRLQRELEDTRRQLAAERRPKHTIASFIGTSTAALEVKRQARRVAGTDSTVLLLGETGTGKELLAHGIHAAGRRAARPFVGVNIAAVPDTLLEAEFFGVAPGAFTGAERKGREGKFKIADGGTLFLDEIGDMPLALQAKLLRVLQEQEIEPLGSNRVERIDVRIVAATSRDLAAMVADGRFRADLYYRLNVLPIRLPPLRERLADLEALVESLAEDIARRSGLPHKSLSAEALEWLAARPWPGNIRELRNALEQASLMTDDAVLEPGHFAGALGVAEAAPAGAGAMQAPAQGPVQGAARGAAPGAAPPAAQRAAADPAPMLAPMPALPERAPLRPLPEQVAEVERHAIAAALRATAGNRVAAARLLQMSRAAFYDRLSRYPELAAIQG